MVEANVNVPNTGAAPIETTAIVLPDGSTAYRQRTDVGDGTDIPAIRRVLEELLIRVSTAGDFIPTPTGQTVKFDETGDLVTSLGVSITGGAKVFKLIALGTTNAVNVKSFAGQIYGWYLFNASAATRFIKLYNTQVPPVLTTDIPVMTLPLPTGAAANVWCASGIGMFTKGIGLATTVNMADNDATAVTANDLLINLWYT